MSSPDEKKPRPSPLRTMAESELAHHPVTETSVRSVAELLHELQVQQVELEMQSEDLRQKQIELVEARGRYVGLFEFAPVGYLTLNAVGTIEEINLTATKLLGTERKNLRHRSFTTLVLDEYKNRWSKFFRNVNESGATGSAELAIQRVDGTVFYAQLDCVRYAGSVRGVLMALSDITQRKGAEEMLRMTRFSVEATSDALFWATPNARIVDVNEAACRSLGYTREELLQLSVPDVDVLYSAELWPQFFSELRRRGSITFESEHRTKDGRVFPVEIVANYFEYNGKIRNCAIVRNITERKHAEAEVLATKNQLQATLDAIPDLLFEVDLAGRIHDYHSHRTDLLAAPPDVFLGKRFSEVLPAEAAKACLKAVTEAANKGRSIGEQYALQLPQGEHWFELSVAPKADIGGQERRFILLARDVTERRRIQAALLEREDDLKLAVEGANLGTWHYDVGRDQLEASIRCRELFGFNPTEEIGVKRFIERIHPDDRASFELALAEGIRSGEAYHLEYRVLRPDGNVVWVVAAGRAHPSDRADDQPHNSGVLMDVTALRAANDRLASFAVEQDRAIEAERKRLAREVHDQIGQVFTAIQLIIHSLPREAFPSGQEAALRQALEMGIATTRKITAELRPPLIDHMGLAAALDHLVNETLPTKNLSFDVDIDAQAALDARQALTLFRIAQEAVTNILRHASATHVVISGRRNGNRYVLRIEDNGRGFAPNDVRKGAMGLVNLRERAILAGGSCEILARPEGGTVVTVLMKVHDNGSDEHPVD